jgi:hypothetical protein
MKNKCSKYKFNFKHLFIPSKLILNKICNIEDKRNLFIVSIIRLIIYVYINIIFNNIYHYLKSNIVMKILLYIIYSILLTSSFINLIIIFLVYKKKIN